MIDLSNKLPRNLQKIKDFAKFLFGLIKPDLKENVIDQYFMIFLVKTILTCKKPIH